ncbi:MAG: type II toxin-antitoxin system death-on-curing family toxin [Devosia sp.]|nr:type II toxin-antitoxin system death-on-curing family toxin [Devosia sp.]
MPERVYLTLDDAVFIHDEQIRLFGGAPGIRDEGLILSALLRPATGYYADVIEEAAALWESLAMNHGFIDGNKRVALAYTVVFLGLNGIGVEADQDELISFIYEHLEGGTFRKAVLEDWLSRHSRPL